MGFIAFSDGLPNDEEFMMMNGDYQHIWLMFFVLKLGGKCGIFKGGISLLARACNRETKQVETAFIEFERLGWIVRENDYSWIRNKIKYHANSENWRQGAYDEARGFIKSTQLAERCLEYYNVPFKRLIPGRPQQRALGKDTDENVMSEIKTAWVPLGYKFDEVKAQAQIDALREEFAEVDLLVKARDLSTWIRSGNKTRNWLAMFKSFCKRENNDMSATRNTIDEYEVKD